MADINPIWGTWHYKEDFLHKGTCYEAVYHINSFGARDAERNRLSGDTNRIIVLGDSFIEGFAVNQNKRLSNILEQNTGKAFLNFGCSDFGVTQASLLYQTLADSFSHSAVMLGLLPHNDFFDDDINYRLGTYDGFTRYRPYYNYKDSDFTLEYYCKNLTESNFNKEGYIKRENTFKITLSRFLRSFTCWFNVLDYFRHYKNQYTRYENNYSGFVDFTEIQFKRLAFSLKQIRMAAKGKRFILFTIPVNSDITRYKQDSKNLLAEKLAGFCFDNNIEFIDLLPVFAKEKETSRFYLSCNPHWGEGGNKFAADTLQKLFQ